MFRLISKNRYDELLDLEKDYRRKVARQVDEAREQIDNEAFHQSLKDAKLIGRLREQISYLRERLTHFQEQTAKAQKAERTARMTSLEWELRYLQITSLEQTKSPAWSPPPDALCSDES